MRVTLVALALWAAGSALNAALVFILIYKRRHQTVPWFTAWLVFQLGYAIACFLVYRLGTKAEYRWVYWIGALVDFLLQVAVILEVAAHVMKREGEWVEGAKSALLPFAVAGPLVGLVLATTMTPATPTLLTSLGARASLFTTILICALFVAVVRGSQRLGLDWWGHVARESYGLTIWTVAAFATDTLHAYWRTMGQWQALEDLRIAFWQAALLYWCVSFWLPETGHRPMPEEVKKKIIETRRHL